MSWEEIQYRLQGRFHHYFHSPKKSVRLTSRLLAFALFASVVTTLAPTLADELAGSPEMIETVPPAASDSATVESPAPSASAEPTATPSASASPEIIRPTISVSSPTPLAEPSESATATVAPAAPLTSQPKYSLRIPGSVSVDPRASNYFFPHISASLSDDSQPTLVCIYGNVNFDISNKQSIQSSKQGSDLISGDQSNFLMISASLARVVNLINSQAGMRIYGGNGGIAGKSLSFQFVALNRPVLNPAFCAAARSQATTSIRALGLEQSTVKGGGTLK